LVFFDFSTLHTQTQLRTAKTIYIEGETYATELSNDIHYHRLLTRKGIQCLVTNGEADKAKAIFGYAGLEHNGKYKRGPPTAALTESKGFTFKDSQIGHWRGFEELLQYMKTIQREKQARRANKKQKKNKEDLDCWETDSLRSIERDPTWKDQFNTTVAKPRMKTLV